MRSKNSQQAAFAWKAILINFSFARCVRWSVALSTVLAFAAAAQESTTVYQYDGLGRLITETRAEEAGETTFTYDAHGNRLTAVERSLVAASFSVDDASANEGGALIFTVTKSGSTTLSHNINYSTAGDTADLNDYQAVSGTLTFSPSETEKTITVQTTHDEMYEGHEEVWLYLANATNNAAITDPQGKGTINNNDSAPSFSINSVTREEGLSLTFTVTKNGSTAYAHSINYATANHSATAPSDYGARSGTLSFAAAETSKTITVPTVQDSAYESNETFYVNLSSATGGAVIAGGPGVGTINNDDPSELVVSIGNSGPVNLRSLANSRGFVTGIPTVRFVVSGVVTGTGGNSSGGNGGNAIDTGSWPGGVSLILVNNGSIRGGGGGGASGSDQDGKRGGGGGHAIFLRRSMTITNNGTIAGGGGGGGSGDGRQGDEDDDEGEGEYGGGGGGGYPNGQGGRAQGSADDGLNGATSGGGAGGSGDDDGGAGGHAGQPGVAAGGAGGAAGFAVKRNGHSGPVTGGTVLGPVG